MFPEGAAAARADSPRLARDPVVAKVPRSTHNAHLRPRHCRRVVVNHPNLLDVASPGPVLSRRGYVAYRDGARGRACSIKNGQLNRVVLIINGELSTGQPCVANYRVHASTYPNLPRLGE